MQPGFYIVETTLINSYAPLGGAWGLTVQASLGQVSGGYNFGSAVPANAAVPAYGAFAVDTNQTITATLTAQATPGTAFTIRLLDSARNPVGSDVTGTVPLVFTKALTPGFYILEVFNGAAVPFTFQMSVAADHFTGGVNAGGYLGPGVTGFGAFYLTAAQAVNLQVFGKNTLGPAGAGSMILTLRDANRNVIALIAP